MYRRGKPLPEALLPSSDHICEMVLSEDGSPGYQARGVRPPEMMMSSQNFINPYGSLIYTSSEPMWTYGHISAGISFINSSRHTFSTSFPCSDAIPNPNVLSKYWLCPGISISGITVMPLCAAYSMSSRICAYV